MKGRAIVYSAEEMAWLDANRLLPIRDYHAGFVEAFGRDDVRDVNLHSLRKRMGWKTGRTGHFQKGSEPVNKGKSCPEGTGGRHPNARRTQFRKGNEPHNTRYLGHERVSREGYIEVSVDQPNPHTGYSRRYVLKHRWLWEQANGPLPKGYCLKCMDGDKLNTNPTNWQAIPRALMPRLNGGNRYRSVLAFDDAAPEVRPTVLAVAKLEHRARTLRKGSSTPECAP